MSNMERIIAKTHKTFFPSKHNDYQPFILRPKNLFILAIILLVVKVLIFSWFFYFPKTSQFAIVSSSDLIDLANEERMAKGLSSLKINDKLVQAAQQKAQDMINQNYFAHTSPLGVNPWHWFDLTGYNYVVAGENLAKDFTDSKILHQAWMNSPSHRDNILNKNYQEVGIAVVEGKINGKNTTLAVQMFGKAVSKKTVKQSEVKTTPVPENTSVPTQEVVSSSVVGGAIAPNESSTILKNFTEKAEPAIKEIYFIVAGLLSLILILTVFINIRVQYPKLIFNALIIIILIAAIAAFNGQAFLNRGIDII